MSKEKECFMDMRDEGEIQSNAWRLYSQSGVEIFIYLTLGCKCDIMSINTLTYVLNPYLAQLTTRSSTLSSRI